uniref:Uncharacterized protein n=1 Tax=Anguilla anguilla TaxID=7936 RepID=A0A0E9S711_ANGAN
MVNSISCITADSASTKYVSPPKAICGPFTDKRRYS